MHLIFFFLWAPLDDPRTTHYGFIKYCGKRCSRCNNKKDLLNEGLSVTIKTEG